MTSPDLTIVIGSQNANRNLESCLRGMAAEPRRIETVVVHAGGEEVLDPLRGRWPEVIFLTAPGRLVPELWATGIERASAPLIALTTAQCTPGPDWIPVILANAELARRGGIGGVIEAPSGGSALDWATLFTRYSSYLPPLPAGIAEEIAGDNAVYAREVLESCWTNRREGFWETLVHRSMRGRFELRVVPDMVIRMGRVDSFASALRIRFSHGRHFGRTRGGSAPLRLARFISAPLLTPLLALRIARRVRRKRPDLSGPLLRSSIHVLMLLTAWSLGEAAGYLSPAGTDG